jgi:putative chitinase
MIELTADALRQIFPRAPQAVLDAFLAKQGVLTKAGINSTRPRLAYFFANIEHECGGFTIPNLTENTNYTASRMAAVWPSRFKGGAAAVVAKYGSAPGWQLLALDDIYGSRMGNRPGTRDGSAFIGRGGPQWTGRDGYAALSKFLGKDAVALPALAARYDLQPEVCAGFWTWKNLNPKADAGNFLGTVKLWNGGTNGLADREHLMAGNDATIQRLATVNAILPTLKALPGAPPTKAPPKDVINAATATERRARKGAVAGGAAGGVSEATKTATEVPHTLVPPLVAYSALGLGVVIFIVATVLIARKKSSVIANWF